jgi:hypothetical protein
MNPPDTLPMRYTCRWPPCQSTLACRCTEDRALHWNLRLTETVVTLADEYSLHLSSGHGTAVWTFTRY